MTAKDLASLLLFGAVVACSGWIFTHTDTDNGAAQDVCDRACAPRRGVVVDRACYCESAGEDLIPVEQLIPDTGCRADTP